MVSPSNSSLSIGIVSRCAVITLLALKPFQQQLLIMSFLSLSFDELRRVDVEIRLKNTDGSLFFNLEPLLKYKTTAFSSVPGLHTGTLPPHSEEQILIIDHVQETLTQAVSTQHILLIFKRDLTTRAHTFAFFRHWIPVKASTIPSTADVVQKVRNSTRSPF
jgi:hypothetical protein